MTEFQFHMFAIPLIYAPIVFGFYASIAYYRKISLAKVRSWRNDCVTTNLSPSDFILVAQNICSGKEHNLLEISFHSNENIRVVIKENPTLMWWFGQIYCIEYTVEEKPKVTLYARGCVFEKSLNTTSYSNTLNSFVKI